MQFLTKVINDYEYAWTKQQEEASELIANENLNESEA